MRESRRDRAFSQASLAAVSSKRCFQHIQPFLELCVGDDERHQKPENVAVSTGRDGQQTVLVAVFAYGRYDLLIGLAGGGIANHFKRAHCAHPVEGPDLGPALLPALCAGGEMLAESDSACAQFFLLDHVEYS